MSTLFSGDETAVFGLLVIGLVLLVVQGRIAWRERSSGDERVALLWLVAASGFALGVHVLGDGRVLAMSGAFFCLSQSVLAYFLGSAARARLMVACAILVVGVPAAVVISFHLTFPLRLASSQIAGVILELVGYAVISRGTEIYVDGSAYAVTEGCSGMVLFDVMVWLALAWVLMRHPSGWGRLVHYLTFVPLVVVGNSLRVVGLVVGAELFGNDLLAGPAHYYVGWVAVALTAFAFVSLDRWMTYQGVSGQVAA